MTRLISMLTGLLLACGANAVSAQSYPTNTIRLVVPYSAGGGADFVARIYAEGLSKSLNQQVIVDNRAGANGNIGAELVAKAKPDGYTLLLTASSSLTINPALYKNLPFNAQEDFEPVGIVAVQPNILVVHPTLPVHSVKELVEYAKAHPGKLNFASAGVGSSGHLSGELFKSVAGVQMVHVPYKGTAPATNDLIAGQVLTMFNNLPPSLALIKDGKLRPLAVTGPERSPTASEVPTMAEAGYPDVEVIVWNAVLAPAGTPTEIVEKLSAQLTKLSKQPDIQKRLGQQGVEPSSEGPKELATRLRDETLRWEKVARSAGIPKE